jgi:hypothetical protein
MSRPKKLAEPQRQQPPAKTFESRENQMIAYAVDLAEKQLREGTASSQVIAHYLKLGSTRERAEKEKLNKEIELLTAKTESLKSAKNVEELYTKALMAMSRYAGQDIEGDSNDSDED